MYDAGMPDADDGHAALHASGVDAGTVMAADSVMPVVPLYAATVVPDVMPVPEIRPPTIGAVAGVPVSVKAVDEPDVLPVPDPCAVNSDALPAVMRALSGPLPKSATAFAPIGKVIAFCASAETAVQHSTDKAIRSFFIYAAKLTCKWPGVTLPFCKTLPIIHLRCACGALDQPEQPKFD